ncbi:Mss4p nuclear export [Balamuthia mandrillaris]
MMQRRPTRKEEEEEEEEGVLEEETTESITRSQKRKQGLAFGNEGEEPEAENTSSEEEEDSEEAEEEEEEEDSEDGEQGSEDESEKITEIMVDFEFYDPKEQDYGYIKQLLTPYLGGEPWNVSELADFVVQQTSVGSTVKVDGGDDVYGFISVLNLHKFKDLSCTKQIVRYMLNKAPSEEAKERLRGLAEDESAPLGLILHERLINVPPQLAPHLYKALLEEMQWACEEEVTGKKSNSNGTSTAAPAFRFAHYLLFSTVFHTSVGQTTANPKKKKTRTGSEATYLRPEDQILHQEGAVLYSFPVTRNEQQSRWTFDGMLTETRELLLISHTTLVAAIEKMHQLCLPASSASSSSSAFHPK